MRCVALLTLAAVGLCLSTAGASPAGDVSAGRVADAGLTTEQLTLQGATVKFQVDVSGEAAMLLVGGVLDAAADVAKQQGASAEQGGPMAQMAMAEPFIGPAKDLIKSLSRVTVLTMAPPSGGAPGFLDHYDRLMASRGWTSLATTRAITGQDAAVYVAPGGKGVFAAVRPNGDELVVVLVTTREPIGDLLGQIVRAGGGKVFPMILASQSKPAGDKQDCQQASADSERGQPAEPGEPTEPAE
jgi:hypothetical protein